MDSPKTLQIETDRGYDENVLQMIDKNLFDVIFDNKNYKLELEKYEKNISFKICADSLLINEYYSLNLELCNFHELNIFFKKYRGVDEIYKFLLDLISDKKYSIISKDSNTMIFILEYPIPGGKTIKIHFDLKKINKEEIIKKQYSIIEDLSNENKLLKEKQEKLIEILKDKSNEIIKLNNEIKYLKKEIDKMEIDFKNIKQHSENYDPQTINNKINNTINNIINNKANKDSKNLEKIEYSYECINKMNFIK